MGTLLNAGEQFLFDSVSIEILKLAGVDNCVLWHFTAYPSVSGTVDCLYGEATLGTSQLHYTPYQVLGFFQEPSRVDEASDFGRTEQIEGRIYFSRRDLEKNHLPQDPYGDLLGDGDIVQLFRQGQFQYFDLRNIERTGWVTDSQVFTHYVSEMVRNTKFLPERKLLGT